MPTKDPTTLPETAVTVLAVPDAGQPMAQAVEDPIAGGNYVRDPVTGALSPNPAFATPTPQE